MKIAMLGLGAYSIALTRVLYKAGNEIIMWSKFEEEAQRVKSTRENSLVLPLIKLEEDIEITTDLKEAVNGADIIIIAVPMFAVRSVCTALNGIVTSLQTICIVSKGIEKESMKFPSEVVYEEIPNVNKICMISGPSFAEELANFAETGLTVASKNTDVIIDIEKAFTCDNLCFDQTDDILGVEICGAIKNVYAILLGILSGMNVPESTKASILAVIINDSRAILEILGGNRKTAYMYAGLGDLLLTCMSTKSRNFTLGVNIGKGLSVEEALNTMSAKTVEGLHSLKSMHKLLSLKGSTVKSLDLIKDILYNGSSTSNILKKIS